MMLHIYSLCYLECDSQGKLYIFHQSKELNDGHMFPIHICYQQPLSKLHSEHKYPICWEPSHLNIMGIRNLDHLHEK